MAHYYLQLNFGRSNSPVSNTRDRWNSFIGPGNFPIHLMLKYTPGSNSDGSNSRNQSTVRRAIFHVTRNVSMGHGCPRYCQIRINRALSLTKGHYSNNNRWILSVIELDLYFMITYLCMKYESNTPTYSKDIARKPFFIRRSRAITLIIIG